MARSHTFVEINHEQITTVILFPLIQEGCYQIQAKVWLTSQEKSVVELTVST